MTGWQDQAACKGLGPALFYPGRGRQSDWEGAIAVCAGCPVKAECLEDALDRPRGDDFGIRGGMSERQRRLLRTRRAREGQAA